MEIGNIRVAIKIPFSDIRPGRRQRTVRLRKWFAE